MVYFQFHIFIYMVKIQVTDSKNTKWLKCNVQQNKNTMYNKDLSHGDTVE